MCASLSQVREAKITEVKINEARENYRPASIRAALMYFILNDLNKINPIYQFSLKVKFYLEPPQGFIVLFNTHYIETCSCL